MAKLKPIQEFHKNVKEGDIVRLVSQQPITQGSICLGKEAVGYVHYLPASLCLHKGTHYFSLVPGDSNGHMVMLRYRHNTKMEYEVLRRKD